MKTIEQIQEENRKFILEAIHGVSYEEALEKELEVGCKVIDLEHNFFGEPEEMILVYDALSDDSFADFIHYRGNPTVKFYKEDILNKDKCKILGKPITLSRVFLALNKTKNKFMITSSGYICKLDQFIGGEEWQNYCYWDLQKETLEEQSEKAQISINKLLNEKC